MTEISLDPNSEIIFKVYNPATYNFRKAKMYNILTNQIGLVSIGGQREPPYPPGKYELPEIAKKAIFQLIIMNTGPFEFCLGVPIKAGIKTKDNIPLGISFLSKLSIIDFWRFYDLFSNRQELTIGELKASLLIEIKNAVRDNGPRKTLKELMEDLNPIYNYFKKRLRGTYGIQVMDLTLNALAPLTKRNLE